ncbi:hypothetical protein FCM35_KLT12752 [Carex littledalei]|uniref:Uncharacterized protein n=1 Tax=Carex littledalei TaxID=544730 RepID=A0A833QNM0_9POAL|nr:hypothetical protein FCM35_KLT12752 [Carex littledalei]
MSALLSVIFGSGASATGAAGTAAGDAAEEVEEGDFRSSEDLSAATEAPLLLLSSDIATLLSFLSPSISLWSSSFLWMEGGMDSLSQEQQDGEARLRRRLSRLGFPPNEVEEYATTDDPTTRSVLYENFGDIDPPPDWEVCPTCCVKGDIAEMFFCHLYGIRVHPKCIDNNADLVNDYHFQM